MPVIRYTAEGGRYRVAGQSFEPGDEAGVSKSLADHLLDRDDFEVVDDGSEALKEDDSPDSDDADGESGTLPFNPENHTNDEIAERASNIDDEAALNALLNLEVEQKDRNGAKDAIDDRLNELEG